MAAGEVNGTASKIAPGAGAFGYDDDILVQVLGASSSSSAMDKALDELEARLAKLEATLIADPVARVQWHCRQALVQR
jgi:hypothetical protein